MNPSTLGPLYKFTKNSFVVSLLFINLFLATTARAQSQEKIEELKRHVVKITAFDKTANSEQYATGIVVGSSHNVVFILTAQHVIEGAQDINVSFFETGYAEIFPASVLPKYNEDLDFAVIKVRDTKETAVPSKFPGLDINDAPLAEQAKVGTIGHSGGDDWQYQPGQIYRTIYDSDSQQFVLTVPNQRGDSGAPVFDEKGFLLGMVTNRTPQGKATARKIAGVLQVLSNEWRIPLSLLRQTSQPTGAPIISRPSVRKGVPFPKPLLKAISAQITKLEELIAEARKIEKAKTSKIKTLYDGWKNRCELVLDDVDRSQNLLRTDPTNFKAKFDSMAGTDIPYINNLRPHKTILENLASRVEYLRCVRDFLTTMSATESKSIKCL